MGVPMVEKHDPRHASSIFKCRSLDSLRSLGMTAGRRTTSLAPDLAMASTAATDRSAPARGAAASHQADEAIAPTSAPLAGFSGTRRVPPPVNEPVKSYAPG